MMVETWWGHGATSADTSHCSGQSGGSVITSTHREQLDQYGDTLASIGTH